MVIQYGKLGAILVALMYKDRMKVERWKDTTNPDGSKGTEVLDSFLVDVPCLVNETRKDSPKDDNLDVSRQDILLSVYCPTDSGVTVGDVLTLSIMGDDGKVLNVIETVATAPSYYPDHMEIRCFEWKVSK